MASIVRGLLSAGLTAGQHLPYVKLCGRYITIACSQALSPSCVISVVGGFPVLWRSGAICQLFPSMSIVFANFVQWSLFGIADARRGLAFGLSVHLRWLSLWRYRSLFRTAHVFYVLGCPFEGCVFHLLYAAPSLG